MCIRVMGSGEYAVDANKRKTAGEFEEIQASYACLDDAFVISPIIEQQIYLRAMTRAERINTSISHFHGFGIGLPVLENATQLASTTKRFAGEELIRSGAIDREGYARISAEHLQVAYSRHGPDPQLLSHHTKTLPGNNHPAQPTQPNTDFCDIATEYQGWQEKPKIYVACEPRAGGAIEKLLQYSAIDNAQIVLTTRKALHNSQFISRQKVFLDKAVHGLARKFPEISASRVITGWQSTLVISAFCAVALALGFYPVPALLAIHVIVCMFYLAVTIMRACMVLPGIKVLKQQTQPLVSPPVKNNELPDYTIMVALYQEAEQVDGLVASLKQINWPHDRTQILLVCEEGDLDTIDKCKLAEQDERFLTVICPTAQPQTKPKALNFALPLAKGKFLVLYDAEDRPHPDQLREAFHKFNTNTNLACLQAPLFIHNDNQSWFTRMFSIEYTTQFGLILPVLEKWKSPIPLGGTSNHFRTEVLKKIGAWDPYNVTEDADLGIRISRFGYESGTITLPTMEEAPPFFEIWFKQRTRWIKGWLQTFLVHMRHPVRMSRELGWRKTVYFHLVITAIITSVLIHPLFIFSGIYYAIALAQGAILDSMTAAIIAIDVVNLVGGYTTYAAIAWLAVDAKQKPRLKWSIIWLPIYWLLISLAGWRALAQLFYKPFFWEKTPHGLAIKKPVKSNRN